MQRAILYNHFAKIQVIIIRRMKHARRIEMSAIVRKDDSDWSSRRESAALGASVGRRGIADISQIIEICRRRRRRTVVGGSIDSVRRMIDQLHTFISYSQNKDNSYVSILVAFFCLIYTTFLNFSTLLKSILLYKETHLIQKRFVLLFHRSWCSVSEPLACITLPHHYALFYCSKHASI